MSKSKICDFYNNQTVFVTGGTGFLGKVLLEKLLRVTHISKVYILVRSKKGKNELTRYEQLLNSKVFEKLKHLQPNFETRIQAVSGDVTCENLNLTHEIQQELISNVNVVFHLAADTRFNVKIEEAYRVNVKGTVNVVKFCKQVKHLRSFVHVSTAFCHLNCADETFYEESDVDDLEQLVEEIESSKLTELTTGILEKWPNTYSLTKILAELYIKNTAQDIPAAIFRPALISAAYNEPMEGWIDDCSGVTKVLSAVTLGFVRLIPVDPELEANFTPVDMTAAALVAVGWDITQNIKGTVPIYNYLPSVDSPINWQIFFSLWGTQMSTFPLRNSRWRTSRVFTLKKTAPCFRFLSFYHNYFPAAIIDLLRMLSFKKSLVVSQLNKIYNVIEKGGFAVGKKWEFANSNTTNLWRQMNDKDKELFAFDFSNFQWSEYVRRYYMGIKNYIETILAAKI